MPGWDTSIMVMMFRVREGGELHLPVTADVYFDGLSRGHAEHEFHA
jgi:hypothetical protein